MHTGLSEILNHNERSSPLLVAYIYMYIASYRHHDISITVMDH